MVSPHIPSFIIGGQWVTIRSIELATGAEHTNSGTIRAGTRVALHPSGDYIYGANNGLSPSDFEKYDIRAGPRRRTCSTPAASAAVQSGSDSDRLGRVVALPAADWGSTLSSEIRVYDQALLAFRGTVPLPGFPRDGGTVPLLGHFIFAARDGNDVYVLVQAEPSGGLSQDWGVVRIPASALP